MLNVTEGVRKKVITIKLDSRLQEKVIAVCGRKKTGKGNNY